MSFVLTTTASGIGSAVCRRSVGDFKCIDYLAPISRDYFGRLQASGALLTFDTVAEAESYNNDNGAGYFVRAYDDCKNSIELDAVRRCEKCGAVLVPGENWYTMKTNYICTDCDGRPSYAPPVPFSKTWEGAVSAPDYERLINYDIDD